MDQINSKNTIMFEFEGREYSMEDIQKEANAQNVEVDKYLEFMKANGLVEKTQDPQIEQSAPVGSIEPALDTDLPSEDISSESQEADLPADGGFFEDLMVAAQQGKKAGRSVDEAFDVFRQGKEISDEDLQGFIDAANEMQNIGQTREQAEFFKAQQENGGGFWGTLKALKDNPGFLPQMMVSSYVTMANSLESGEVVASTATGAAVGTAVPVVGTLTGGLAGLVSSMETGLTLTDLIQTELGDAEFNKENVRKILEDEDKFKKIKNRALGRGLTIGAIEGATMGISRGVGSKIVKTSKAAPIPKSLQVSGATAGIETTGAFAGEVGGQIAAGQEVDLGEAVLESVSEIGSVVNTSDVVAKAIRKPKYKINGELRSKEEILEILNDPELDAADLAKMKFDVDNDQTFANEVTQKLNDAITETQIDDSITESSDRKQLVELENLRKEAEAKTKKKGIFKAPNAEKELADIQLEIDNIVKKYEGVDRRKKPSVDIRKAGREVRVARRKFLMDEITEGVKKSKAFKEADIDIQEVSPQEAVDLYINQETNNLAFDLALLNEELNNVTDPAEKSKIQDKIKQVEAESNALQEQSKEAADAHGFLLEDNSTGKMKIIINKDKAVSDNGNINVAAHEFLHAVLRNTFMTEKGYRAKEAKGLGVQTGNKLIQYLFDNKEGELLVDGSIINRLQSYEGGEVKGQEVLNLLSDAFVKVGYNQKSEGFLKGLGNRISDVLKAYLPTKQLEFKNGKQVFDFVSTFKKAIEGDKVSGRIIERARRKGIKITPDRDVDTEAASTPFSKEASDRVQQVYEQQGEGGLFDILEEFKPITTRIARRFRDVPGYDEQLVIDEIETGKRGIFDLIREYKPESGVPLAAYINKFLPARSIEAGNRILKTDFESDVTEARGVAATETAEDVIEPTTKDEGRKTKAKVIADQLNIADKVALEVAESNIDPNTLTNFKSVPNAVRNTVGEMLGISPAKIKSKANLTKDEVANAQRWFKKNRQLVIDALPQGFDVEGKATGVPKTVLQALYTQKETRAKTKAGLKGQVKRTNIKDSEFLELVDIIDNVPTRNRNTSARIIALADLLGKTITNQEIRKTIPGTEKIRSGMSNVMFSKSVRNLTEEKQSLLFEKLPELTSEVNPSYLNVKNSKEVKRIIKRVYGDKFSTTEVNNIAKELGKLSDVYEPTVSNKSVVPEKDWTEFVADSFDQAADNIIEALQLTVDGKTPTAASLYDNIEQVARARRAVIEFGNSLIDSGMSPKDVARKMALLKPMYASSAKIGRGMVAVDNKGNLYMVKGDKFGSPRGQVFMNVSDFENNAVLKIEGITPNVWKSANKKLLPQKSKDAVKNPNYKQRLQESIEARQAIDEMMKFLNESEFHNDLDVAMFMISNLSNMGAPLRRAANLQYIADAVKDMKVEDLGKLAEYEHLIPANYMAIKIIEAYKSGDVNIDNLYKNYKVAVIPKTMDDVIKMQGLQSKMHAGYNFDTDSSTDRYYNFLTKGFDNIVPIRDISNNQQVGVAFSKPGKKPKISEAIINARPALQYSKESRGMSTFDFDETLIIDGENFIVAKKGDDVQRISSGDWPLKGPQFAADGYEFDFTDFVNVRGGVDGPLLQKMKNQIKKYGTQNVFVLTARPAESATAIHEWLKTKGINIPFENITGLGNSSGDAKAAWMLDKYEQGYNDMYFVDDALPNVKAVQHVFDQLDVKGKSVQARVQFSKGLSKDFNDMLQRTKGVGAEKVYSRIAAQKRGKNIGRFEFFVPPSADDFAGLLRSFVGKGKQGDADLKFFKRALIDPFARADEEMKRARQAIMDDYKTLRKEFPDVVKKLGKLTDTESGFTFDNAVRVYLWDKAGFEIPGLSKRDIQKLVNVVRTDQDLKNFADTLGLVSKNKEGYIKPTEYWNVESIAADLQNIVNKEGRKKYLAEWVENKDQIFSKENLNKIEAVYGSNFREALENMLWRMENGTNRPKGMGRLEAAWNNWVNNSVGAIMFFNARSAVLQTLSSVNFINFEDNNIFAAAKAFGNQKQYWKDFSFLFNSDFLKQRRAGLQTNINEAELASAVAGASNKAKAALQYLLKIGFTPTQIADSFAIAAGGSTYYRNRIKKYVKEGLSQSEAESKAMLDFQEIAEETQQSARPDRISQQQASSLGRIILAFANTPMQYARLIKKAAKDLAAGRGDWRSNVSRIIYYGAVQNIIFSALQSAIFALAFDDEDPKEDEINTKTLRTLNGVVDSLLRGSGLAGAAVATIKNTVMRFLQESDKGFRADYGNVLVDALNVSPPIGSKARKLYNALKTYKFNRDEMGEMETFDLENPVWDAVGNVVSATTNVPLDRGFRKIDNMKEALDQDNQTWQRIALALGWDQWSLGVEQDKKPKATKSKGRSSIEKAKERRRKRLEKLRNR